MRCDAIFQYPISMRFDHTRERGAHYAQLNNYAVCIHTHTVKGDADALVAAAAAAAAHHRVSFKIQSYTVSLAGKNTTK